MKIAGILIMLLGFILSVFTASTFFTPEKVVDLGVLEITQNQPHYFNWSPFVGLGIMVVGGFFILQSRKK